MGLDFEKPLISICIMTYNHEKYIRRAIESVLSQKTALPYEVIVSDDFSTDNTVEILKEYGDSIRIITHEKNMGLSRNFYEVLTNARGEYICDLAGDDWWITDDYIDLHYRYLQEHEKCVAVAHWSKKYDEYGNYIDNVTARLTNQTMYDFLWRTKYGSYHYGMVRNFFNEPDNEWLYQVVRNTDEVTYPFYILMHGEWGILQEYCYGYRTARVGADNFNSRYDSIDNFLMIKQASEKIEKEVTSKYIFDYYVRSYGADALRTCLANGIKRRNWKTLSKMRKATTVRERVGYFFTLILFTCNHGEYPDWFKRNKALIKE